MTVSTYQDQQDDMQLKMARNHVQLFANVAGEDFMRIYGQVRTRTMLSIERLYDLYLSCLYVDAGDVPGCILEVGVWKGGALATTILTAPNSGRNVIGFDTFEGHFMPEPDEIDLRGHNMRDRWVEAKERGEQWAAADFKECENYLKGLAVSPDRVNLIKGDLKQTIPLWSRQEIAILRIDCDWYLESKVTLQELWPLVSIGGIVILDDYGHHDGQRRAVDEFFAGRHVKLTHVDYSCVSIVKTA